MSNNNRPLPAVREAQRQLEEAARKSSDEAVRRAAAELERRRLDEQLRSKTR